MPMASPDKVGMLNEPIEKHVDKVESIDDAKSATMNCVEKENLEV